MEVLQKAEIILLSSIIITISASEPNLKNCTEAEKIYYGTYKFGACYRDQSENWCYKGSQSMANFPFYYEESDPEHYSERGQNCSAYSTNCENCYGNSTSCDYIQFLTQVCGAHYDVCHTHQERKDILKMWIKQFIREIVYREPSDTRIPSVYFYGYFKNDNLELRNGKCNHILQEFFNDKEMNEISAMVEPADVKQLYIGSHLIGVNSFSNVTIKPMGVLANAEGTKRMPTILEDRDDIGGVIDKRELTLPSHWKYCTWKLIQTYKDFEIGASTSFGFLPDFWHCDGKCNSNNGDDQAWYTRKLTMTRGGYYIDLNNGEHKTEDYVADLQFNLDALGSKNNSLKGIYGCHDYYKYARRKYDECSRYQNFLTDCLDLIDRCLGNTAIREVVLYATVQHFKPSECFKVKQDEDNQDVSNGNYFMSSLVLTMFCHLYHRILVV